MKKPLFSLPFCGRCPWTSVPPFHHPLSQALCLAGGGAGHRQEISWSEVEVLCLHVGVWRAQHPCKNIPQNTPNYMTLGRSAWQMSLPRHVSLGYNHVWTLCWHTLPCPSSVRWMALGQGQTPITWWTTEKAGWTQGGLQKPVAKDGGPDAVPPPWDRTAPLPSTRGFAHRLPTGQKSSWRAAVWTFLHSKVAFIFPHNCTWWQLNGG